MQRRSSHRVFALLVAGLLAVGTMLSAVQAGDMAVDMALAPGIGTGGLDDCCGNSDDGDMSAADCTAICANPAPAIVPSGFVVTETVVAVADVSGGTCPQSRIASPEPHPPKPETLV